jgi:anti-sigma factor RsiW
MLEMLDDNHVIDLLPAYSLGSLDGGEAARVSEHLPGCLECRIELDVFQMVTAQLALGARESDPPQGLKRRLFDQLQPQVKRHPAIVFSYL